MNYRGWSAYRLAESPSGNLMPFSGATPETGERSPELADVTRLGRALLRRVVNVARADEAPSLTRELVAHMGAQVAGSPVLTGNWASYEHVNVAVALDTWLADSRRSHRLLGVTNFQHHLFGLAELAHGGPHLPGLGAVSMRALPCGPGGRTRPCVACGLYLVQDGDIRLALLLRAEDDHGPMGGGVVVEVAVAVPAPEETAAAVLAELRELALAHNVFRGHVLEFGGEVFGPGVLLSFLERPELPRESLVLADGVLAAVEEQVVGVARHRDALRASGQHLRRGLLLYGPPGTGKTHTVRYLLGLLEGVTTVILRGNALQLVGQACSVARALQPSVLVIEDVDLIAEDRGMHPGANPLLFELLNEMDGLGDDVDIVFLLTTNRADLLEGALAARPGRVDLAVEITLPDASGRRRLVELYVGGLDLEVSEEELADVVDRTDGMTAPFIKELLRRAALRAANRQVPAGAARLRVAGADLTGALDTLLAERNGLTRILLGGGRDAGSHGHGSGSGSVREL